MIKFVMRVARKHPDPLDRNSFIYESIKKLTEQYKTMEVTADPMHTPLQDTFTADTKELYESVVSLTEIELNDEERLELSKDEEGLSTSNVA
ncbi:hypothetical protein COV04_00655 [Candidatus Uhrbacteria bacterium CG10_big_fil_rev_8_21_14_0_10_48_11]|uniref:Uncharacterized protein n=1 Tax=Candidatus Uhrbacteria bacterium CG10_big_fil_rev_8_21_14_0_10_48_11 TaxID=1975037 RepID=A0A2M8LFN0_9BACT|nr:MAG: hypothetical protein COV04_00655 [Candidatus Uhrbacteria bacterium CG10_big_fil_rev_8_21_14_0_10_48_11]